MTAIRRQRNVKIVATLGPASDTFEMIRSLFVAGADVFRLNMSHGTHDDIARRHALIRQVEADVGRPIGILADLQGPKLRCGTFAAGSAMLAEGAAFRFDLDPTEGDATRVCLPHPEIFAALEVGSTLLVNDGKIRLKVTECSPKHAVTEVVVGGEISNRKGVNVPDVVLPLAALSDKDRKDLEFACELGVDWLALSFVQRAERRLRGARAGRRPRGDPVEDREAGGGQGLRRDPRGLGRHHGGARRPRRRAAGPAGAADPEAPDPRLPRRRQAGDRRDPDAREHDHRPVPTRAEVSDVATAIYEGADAVMLSAESAAGEYPVEAVTTMNNVAEAVEHDEIYRQVIEAQRTAARSGVSDAITVAAREVAETTQVKAICCFSHSGTTALLAARERPRVPIIALTPLIGTARRLALSWGLHCVVVPEVDRFKMAVVSAARAAREHGFAAEDDRIVVTAGIPFGVAGSTNILRVATANERAIFEGGGED